MMRTRQNGWSRRRADSRVTQTYKAIARLIHARGLQPGERLPPQAELRHILGASNDTLSTAMGLLVADGVLGRKTGAGTVVVDSDGLKRINWSIGLAVLSDPEHRANNFFARLSLELIAELSRLNCRCTSYALAGTTKVPFQVVANYPRLREDIEHGHLDGLLILTNLAPQDWRRITRRGIPICHVGVWETMPCAVLPDLHAMVRQSMGLLEQSGSRRIAVLHNEAGEIELVSGPACATLAREIAKGPCEAIAVSPSEGAGRAIAQQLLRRGKASRPDACIVLDDYVAREKDYGRQIAAITLR